MGIWAPGPGPTAGDDTFTGDGANETAAGGDGNDILHGGGGSDTLTLDFAGDQDELYGDAGDDLIVFDTSDEDTLVTVDGGDGYDTLWVKGTVLTADSSITGIERLVLNTGYLSELPVSIFAGISTFYARGAFQMNAAGVIDLSGVTIPDKFTFDGVEHDSVLVIYGSEGDDTVVFPDDPTTNGFFAAFGFGGDDTLTGGDNYDDLRGGQGDDVINGGGGGDEIYVGASGANGDVVNGGAGGDLIRIDEFTKAAIDGGDGVDMVYLGDPSGGGLLTGSSLTNVEYLLIDNARINPNSLNGVETILFARYQAFLTLAEAGTLDFTQVNMPATYSITVAGTLFQHDDPTLTFTGTDGDDALLLNADAPVLLFFALGGAGDDHIMGGGRDDEILGGEGNNILEGQDGNDVLRHSTDGHDFGYGGSGDDTFEIDGGFGSYTLNGGAGNDTLLLRTHSPGGAMNGINTGTTLSSVETILIPSFGGGTVYIAPDALGTTGTLLIANQVITLSAPGVLDLSGFTTPETFVYEFQTYENALRLHGSSGNDTLIAPAALLVNGAHGGAGSDTLYGGNRDDYLLGETGDDLLFGGNGNDSLTGDDVEDGAGDDILDGGAGNDSAFGGYGNDVLVGGAGADILDGGEGRDVASYATHTTGITINLLTPGLSTGHAAGDSYVSVEVVLGTSFTDTLTGNNSDNNFRGAGGVDTLNGGIGNDTLEGGALGDILNGGEGFDTASYETASVGVTVDLATPASNTGEAAGDSFNSIELLQGSAFADTLLGTTGANSLFGDSGNDQLIGRAGADFLSGGSGSDTANYSAAAGAVVVNLSNAAANTGEAAGDTFSSIENLIGSSFADALTGDGQANVLNGGGGADVLQGGAGNDVYLVDVAGDAVTEGAALDGTDRVESLVSFTLGANLENLTLLGAGAINATGNAQNNILNGNSSANILDGKAGADAMSGGAGNDTYYVDNAGDTVTETSAGGGADRVNSSVSFILTANIEDLTLAGGANIDGTGNTGGNTILGNTGANIIRGGGGGDTLSGGAGADELIDFAFGPSDTLGDALSGGEGDDIIQAGIGDQIDGGAGADQLIFTFDRGVSAYLDVSSLNFSTEYSGTFTGWVGTDPGTPVEGSVQGVETLIVRFVGVSNASTVFTYHGGLFADDVEASDGSDVLLGYDGADIVHGAGGHDLIFGDDGADTLFGDAGDDNLSGGANADQLDGGSGMRDRVSYSQSNAGVSVDLSTNTVSGGHADGDAITNFEGAVGSAHSDMLTGTSAANALFGGGGSDTLVGANGDDELTGGAGGDILNGGSGNDAAGYSDALAGVVVNLSSIASNTGDAAGDTFISIESLIGSAFNDTLTGSSASNIIDGGVGADAMTGYGGNDVYVVDNAGDVVTEGSAAGGTDRVESRVSFTLGTNLENLTLKGTGAINATGNTLANILLGNGSANILDGKEGADAMSGYAGDDVYIVDDAGDVVTEGSASGGVDRVEVRFSYTLGTNVENLTLKGTTAINATGNTLANALIGNGGANILDGKEGADVMTGYAGNDIYIVDNSGDVVTEGSSSGGVDLVEARVSFTLGANVENLTLKGTGAINATGNTLANILIGNGGANILDGKGGADAMTGYAGNDVYIVNSAGDVVIEGSSAGGVDRVQSSVNFTLGANFENLTLTGTDDLTGHGNSLANVIVGNTGDNELNGLTGADRLTGGVGDDIFEFTTALSASNIDRITDFVHGEDLLHLENSVFTALGANGVLAATAFHTGAAAADAADRIIYNSATGALLYDADGSGGGAAVQFATLGTGVGLTNTDIFII